MSERNEISKIIFGILLVLGLHILALIVLTLLVYTVNILGGATVFPINILWIYAVFGIGISQLLYVIPLIIRLKQQQRWGLMKGVIIGAVITALLNGGCWLLLTR
jgi:hypothetical protein